MRSEIVDPGGGDLDDGHRVVGFARFIDRKRGIGRISAEIVFSGFCRPLLEIVGHYNMSGDALRSIREEQRLLIDVYQTKGLRRCIDLEIIGGLNEHQLGRLVGCCRHRGAGYYRQYDGGQQNRPPGTFQAIEMVA